MKSKLYIHQCYFIIGLFSILFFYSCTPKSQSSLLSDRVECSIEDCPLVQSKIDGSLSIEPDSSGYQLNVDKSDIIEISGKCNDLSISKNRIYVRVYEGEDTSVDPYIDNANSPNCIGSLTSEMNNQRCFWITQGAGVVDNGLEYPQCFNGRFSFSVRLGRIIRTTEPTVGSAGVDDALNPRKKYLVRFKLVTNDGAISESPWNAATVDRGVSKVTFNQVTDFSTFKCTLALDAFKNSLPDTLSLPGSTFLSDIAYKGDLVREYINGNNAPAVNIYPTNYVSFVPPNALLTVLKYPIATDGSSILSYDLGYAGGLSSDGQVIPGVKHKVTITSYDNKYNYSAVRDPSFPEKGPVSEEVQCGYKRADLTITGGLNNTPTTVCTGQKTCKVTVQFPVGISSGIFQWMMIKNKTGWDENFEPGATPNFTVTTLVNDPSWTFTAESYPGATCTPSGSPTTPAVTNYGGNYLVAVRYINGIYTSAWSNPINCPWSD